MKYLANLGFIGILLTGCGGGGVSESRPTLIHVGGTSGGAETKVVTADEGKPGALGQQVHDGDLAFVVTKVSSTGTVGDPVDPALQANATGTFVVVHLEVLNLGSTTHSFLGDEQKLRDATGNTYAPDSMANILARNAEQLEPGAELGAGAQKRSVLVYDLPAGTIPKEIDLHTDYSSKGAKVLLG
ncbi:DUF4352 domain-containing protein [Mycobacterium sp. CBMA271]|uniref:DUF4352 domain-containing protein n=1 Tax=unclassified Mycobacteroides TaxID=2618759 RepID=UPI0012DC52E7|nr:MULTISPECIES: DUF4352 domain-containing protein [unclassified Mycobacteroides]MUM19572.1 hypothetical protein [Mycobacteroides sp. CBMA 326]MUM24174.1 DUF4352 domain-containing protein [Mycobacteroides sp. CBMA 271]